ncbi:MAG: glycosyltransferase family 2 protein [Magnetococcales bacterium]|nr:glycosyltransferase family 2 protein [Magnetococcales bacterium]
MPEPTPLPLSVVLITRNAEAVLEPCLRSVPCAAEIVVVDTASTDRTQAIARAHGARVFDHPWQGFGPQKQFAVAQASHPWVLCLDADERVSPELRRSLEELFARGEPEPGAYDMPRRNRFMGRWLRHGEGYPDPNLRLFHRDYARWSDDLVHEHVLSNGPVGRLEGDLLHETDQTLEDYLTKQNRYTSIQAHALIARGRRPGLARLLLSPLARFVKFYFLRRGFLDGVPGLVHVVIGCFNSFIKYAKARDGR